MDCKSTLVSSVELEHKGEKEKTPTKPSSY